MIFVPQGTSGNVWKYSEVVTTQWYYWNLVAKYMMINRIIAHKTNTTQNVNNTKAEKHGLG